MGGKSREAKAYLRYRELSPGFTFSSPKCSCGLGTQDRFFTFSKIVVSFLLRVVTSFQVNIVFSRDCVSRDYKSCFIYKVVQVNGNPVEPVPSVALSRYCCYRCLAIRFNDSRVLSFRVHDFLPVVCFCHIVRTNLPLYCV